MYNLTFEDNEIFDIVKGESRTRNLYIYDAETFKPKDITGLTLSLNLKNIDGSATACLNLAGTNTNDTMGLFTVTYLAADIADLVEGDFQQLELVVSDGVSDDNHIILNRKLSVTPLFC